MVDKISQLRLSLDKSNYTVALCGSGCLKECGISSLKTQQHAYDIEVKYGISPEYIYTSAYYSTRPKQFFDFYRNELLTPEIHPGVVPYALAQLEQEGKVHCILSSNIFDLARRAGCQNVINLHGTIYDNYCTSCGHNHSIEYIKNTNSIPLCEKCGHAIRPHLSFFGDMIDNSLITQALEEIEKADFLLLLGTSMHSEVFRSFIQHFRGQTIAVLHEENDVSNNQADLVIHAQPCEVFRALGYC